MSSVKANIIADAMAQALGRTREAAAKIPKEKRMAQIQEGKAHPTWLFGHMAFATSFPALTIALGKRPVVPMDWLQKFGPEFAGGQPITADESAYPSWTEITDQYKASGEALVAAIRELDDSDLEGGAKGQVPEQLAGMFTNLGNALMLFVGHNAYHTGQMNQIAALD